MKAKIYKPFDESKAQLEVWEWKEQVYESLKDIPTSEKIQTIITRNQEIVERIKSSKRKKRQTH